VQVVSDKRAWHEITDALGERFEIAFNTYKPFACGVVIHPAIDACVQLRRRGVSAAQVERIDLRVHPLVLELTGKKAPKDGLQGKFSVYHGCAVGLLYGRAGESEFSDATVNDAQVVALRDRVHANVDAAIAEEAVVATARLRDGGAVEVRVDHAVGSLHNPLSDADLEAKFAALVTPILGEGRLREITAAWRSVGAMDDVRALTALCRP
jgi:2-methylcitrate dehydratase PrpD